MYVLQCGDYNDIITWTPSGLAFVILNPVAFEKIVLPQIFKEAKFSSFQRKVSRYHQASMLLVLIWPMASL